MGASRLLGRPCFIFRRLLPQKTWLNVLRLVGNHRHTDSSPMGLASDTEPVPILFLRQTTHIVNSMRLAFDYFPANKVVYLTMRTPTQCTSTSFIMLNVSSWAAPPLKSALQKHPQSTSFSFYHRSIGSLSKEIIGSTDHMVALLDLFRSHPCKVL